jgi:tRNA(Ile)-lysidine synthase
VTGVLHRVTATAREHDLFRAGDGVLVACSGGPDSVCLLHSLWRLRTLLRIRLEVFTFDHGLRPESSDDAEYVRRLAARLGLPFHLRVARDRPLAGASIEAWARSRRDLAASEVAGARATASIATGHTLDDQAETLLAWALMGDGLRAIEPRTGPYVRPLLEVSREEVEAFCRALHLRPRRDATNSDPRYLRNALRLEAIPALERATGRGVRAPLARTARRALEDDRELTEQMLQRWDSVFVETPEGARLLASGLGSCPTPIARRLIERAIYRCDSPATYADIDAILDLAAGRPGRRRDLTSGLKARRDRVYVSLSRPSPESRV